MRLAAAVIVVPMELSGFGKIFAAVPAQKLVLAVPGADTTGAYTRWFNDWALLTGWAVGTAAGTAMAIAAHYAPTYASAFGGFSFPGYTAFYTAIVNLVVVVVLTPVLNAYRGTSPMTDETAAADYRV